MVKFALKKLKIKNYFSKIKRFGGFGENKITLMLLIILGIAFCFDIGFGPPFFYERIIKKSGRPNLILISIDSLGANHMSCYGYQRKTTPNIDKFAEDGILFKNFIVPSWLTPVNAMALHTGTYPTTNNVINFDTLLSDDYLTLAQILKIFNYRTVAFSSNFIYSRDFSVSNAGFYNFSRGFDVYNFKPDRGLIDIDEIIKSLKKEEGGSPYFLWLPLGSVHWPYDDLVNVPPRFIDKNYKGFLREHSLRLNRFQVLDHIYNNVFYPIFQGVYTNFWQLDNKIELNKNDIQYIVDNYDGGVFKTDQWIGSLLKKLKKEKIDENTIIILTAEHGQEWGEHGNFCNVDIYDSVIRAPLIIKYSKLNNDGLVIENQAQSIDVLPTILDFLGIRASHQVEGLSLSPLISGTAKEDFNKYVFLERTPLGEHILGREAKPELCPSGKPNKNCPISLYEEFQALDKKNNFYDVGVRTNEWKLIYRQSREIENKYSWWNFLTGRAVINRPEFELYNLKDDPLEQKNLYGNPETLNIFNELKIKLFDWLKLHEKTKFEPETTEPIQEYF